MTPMLVYADHHLIAGRISVTCGASQDRLSGQSQIVTALSSPQDWQPQSAVFHYVNKIDLPALAVQPGGRISIG
jgi:hypothetical protein